MLTPVRVKYRTVVGVVCWSPGVRCGRMRAYAKNAIVGVTVNKVVSNYQRVLHARHTKQLSTCKVHHLITLGKQSVNPLRFGANRGHCSRPLETCDPVPCQMYAGMAFVGDRTRTKQTPGSQTLTACIHSDFKLSAENTKR